MLSEGEESTRRRKVRAGSVATIPPLTELLGTLLRQGRIVGRMMEILSELIE